MNAEEARRASLRRLETVRGWESNAYRHGTKQEFLAQEAENHGYNPDTVKKA